MTEPHTLDGAVAAVSADRDNGSDPEALGLRPFADFEDANRTWPRGDRPAAIRDAAAQFRARFARPDNRVDAIRTVDIASAPYPLKFAFGGAAKGPNPYINIINRLQVVQFEDFEGRLRTLAYEPTVTDGPQEAPFYEQMMRFPTPRLGSPTTSSRRSGTSPTRRSGSRGCGPRTST